MKPRWLLLAVSVICLLVLAPAAALSQEATLHLGCGSPTIDGRVDATEWANAATVTIWGGAGYDASREETARLLQDAQLVYESGTAQLLHDENNLYLGVIFRDPQGIVPDDPGVYDLRMNAAIEDEPAGMPGRWIDCEWDSDSCAESAEGEFFGLEWASALGFFQQVQFVPGAAPHQDCWGDAVDDPPGVVFDAAPRGAEAHYEMKINLDDSPLDNVGVGDCFDLRWIWLSFTVQDGGSITGLWPREPVDWDPYTGECTVLCLDPCEVEFVPEPGTILLLSSGLLGLAGYASLRWRRRE